jgi:hypothetical protein
MQSEAAESYSGDSTAEGNFPVNKEAKLARLERLTLGY